MTIKTIDDYFGSSIHKPFFLAVGDTEYNLYLQALKSRTVSYIRISDCCRAKDKKPDMDIFHEKMETGDVSFSCNNIVVLGLGEYLGLEGDSFAKSLLSELADYNLGNAQAVLLLRGVSSQVRALVKNDRRLIESGRIVIEDDLNTDIRFKFSDPDLAIYDISGIRDALKRLEEGAFGEIDVNTYMTFPDSLFPIQIVKDAYEAIDKRIGISGFVKRVNGKDSFWEQFLEELREQRFDIGKLFQKHGFIDFQLADLHEILYKDDYTGWLFYVNLLMKKQAGTENYGSMQNVVGCPDVVNF